MWVRIDEVSFPPAQAGAVARRVRDTAAMRFGGDGFRGFRLLVDGPNGRALEVSYWDSEDAASGAGAREPAAAGHPSYVTLLRTERYELAVDSA